MTPKTGRNWSLLLLPLLLLPLLLLPLLLFGTIGMEYKM